MMQGLQRRTEQISDEGSNSALGGASDHDTNYGGLSTKSQR